MQPLNLRVTDRILLLQTLYLFENPCPYLLLLLACKTGLHYDPIAFIKHVHKYIFNITPWTAVKQFSTSAFIFFSDSMNEVHTFHTLKSVHSVAIHIEHFHFV